MRIRTISVVAGVILLSGCSATSGPSPDPEVATLQSAGPSAAPSATPRERPVVGPDEGAEEFDRYVAVYADCLRDNGVAVADGAKPSIAEGPKGEAAKKKCEHLYPETWMDRERRTDPEFEDRLRDTARCLKGKGHDVTVGGDPVSIRYADNASANRAYDDQVACEKEAFKATLKKYAKAG